MKKASDFAKEKCYTTKMGKTQHKMLTCRYLKGREVTETNRREAYFAGARTACIYCWWNTKIQEVEVSETQKLEEARTKLTNVMRETGAAPFWDEQSQTMRINMADDPFTSIPLWEDL